MLTDVDNKLQVATDRVNRFPEEASEDLHSTRRCFPTFTMIGVLALLLLVGISWLRNRQIEPAKPSIAGAETGGSQVAADEANRPAVTRPALPVRP